MSSRLIGHEPIIRRLGLAWHSGRLAHAYLFAGPSGVGKRVAARQFSQAILCSNPDPKLLLGCGHCNSCTLFAAANHPDYIEVARPADKNEFPIEVIRDFCGQLAMKPMLSGRRAAVVDNAESFTEEAANAFLKTLEEPPPGSLLILITDNEDQLLPTILSRCQIIRFTELSESEVAQILLEMKATDDPAEAAHRARFAGGSLETAIELADEEWRTIRLRMLQELAQAKPATHVLAREIVAFCEAAGKEAAAKRRRARQLVGIALDFFRSVLRRQTTGELTASESETRWIDAVADRCSMDVIIDLLERTLQADYHVGRYLHLVLTLECWLDDLCQIMTGEYVPAVGQSY